MNSPANLVEPHRPAPLAQQLHHQHSPLVPDAGQRLADHGALTHVPVQRVIFTPLAFSKAIRSPDATSGFDAARLLDGTLRLAAPSRFDVSPRFDVVSHLETAPRLHRLINVTGFQISAFLRVPPVVTILALVTKRNQAT